MPDMRDVLKRALPKDEFKVWDTWLSTFYPFQLEWLLDGSRFAVCNKSRQIGMSHTTAALATLWAAVLAETTTVISVGQREAEEVLDKVDRHAKALQRLGSKLAVSHAKGEVVVFENGGRVIALPATSGGRSFSGNVFLDEFAYIEKPDKVWDAASGVVLHGYRMRVASTPNGVGNAFYDLWSNPERNRGWRQHEFPLKRALAEGMRVSVDDCWKSAKGDPRLFAQLFECSFLDGAEQYLPTDKILAACVPELEHVVNGRRFAGLDVGLKKDLTVLTVVEQGEDGRVHVVDMDDTCKRTDWESQQAMVEASAAAWGWERLCIDATGLGAVPSELLQKKLGRMRVEPISFTAQSKEVMATTLYQAFNDNMVCMLRDAALIKDLCSLRRMITAAGNVRYDAPDTAEGHADRAWSLALAIHACTNKPTRTHSYGDGDFSSGR